MLLFFFLHSGSASPYHFPYRPSTSPPLSDYGFTCVCAATARYSSFLSPGKDSHSSLRLVLSTTTAVNQRAAPTVSSPLQILHPTGYPTSPRIYFHMFSGHARGNGSSGLPHTNNTSTYLSPPLAVTYTNSNSSLFRHPAYPPRAAKREHLLPSVIVPQPTSEPLRCPDKQLLHPSLMPSQEQDNRSSHGSTILSSPYVRNMDSIPIGAREREDPKQLRRSRGPMLTLGNYANASSTANTVMDNKLIMLSHAKCPNPLRSPAITLPAQVTDGAGWNASVRFDVGPSLRANAAAYASRSVSSTTLDLSQPHPQEEGRSSFLCPASAGALTSSSSCCDGDANDSSQIRSGSASERQFTALSGPQLSGVAPCMQRRSFVVVNSNLEPKQTGSSQRASLLGDKSRVTSTHGSPKKTNIIFQPPRTLRSCRAHPISELLSYDSHRPDSSDCSRTRHLPERSQTPMPSVSHPTNQEVSQQHAPHMQKVKTDVFQETTTGLLTDKQLQQEEKSVPPALVDSGANPSSTAAFSDTIVQSLPAQTLSAMPSPAVTTTSRDEAKAITTRSQRTDGAGAPRSSAPHLLEGCAPSLAVSIPAASPIFLVVAPRTFPESGPSTNSPRLSSFREHRLPSGPVSLFSCTLLPCSPVNSAVPNLHSEETMRHIDRVVTATHRRIRMFVASITRSFSALVGINSRVELKENTDERVEPQRVDEETVKADTIPSLRGTSSTVTSSNSPVGHCQTPHAVSQRDRLATEDHRMMFPARPSVPRLSATELRLPAAPSAPHSTIQGSRDSKDPRMHAVTDTGATHEFSMFPSNKKGDALMNKKRNYQVLGTTLPLGEQLNYLPYPVIGRRPGVFKSVLREEERSGKPLFALPTHGRVSTTAAMLPVQGQFSNCSAHTTVDGSSLEPNTFHTLNPCFSSENDDLNPNTFEVSTHSPVRPTPPMIEVLPIRRPLQHQQLPIRHQSANHSDTFRSALSTNGSCHHLTACHDHEGSIQYQPLQIDFTRTNSTHVLRSGVATHFTQSHPLSRELQKTGHSDDDTTVVAGDLEAVTSLSSISALGMAGRKDGRSASEILPPSLNPIVGGDRSCSSLSLTHLTDCDHPRINQRSPIQYTKNALRRCPSADTRCSVDEHRRSLQLTSMGLETDVSTVQSGESVAAV